MGKEGNMHGRGEKSYGWKPKVTNNLEDQGTDGKIILDWIWGNWVDMCGMAASGS
jgi:hypothetical protein